MTRSADNDNSKSDGGPGARPSGGPKGPITDTMAKPRLKRFFKTVGVGDSEPYAVSLDNRPVKTPKKRALALPTRALADAIAAEWSAQGDHIDPATMPLTRMANTTIDAVADNPRTVAADITAFAGSDLVCYRAEAPSELATAQADLWDPVVTWARDTLGAPFRMLSGVMPMAQPAEALAAIDRIASEYNPFELTALHVMTTLTGSALLALAQAQGVLSLDAAWAAAHVDEDYQIARWGEDEEAAVRRERRLEEFAAASRFLQLAAS